MAKKGKEKQVEDTNESKVDATDVNEAEDQEKQEEVLDEKDLKIRDLEDQIKRMNEEITKIKKGAADVMNRNKQLDIDMKYASTGLVRNLLVPISYFEGALKYKSDNEQFNNFLKGFEMVYNLLLEQLVNAGLKEINVNINDEFEPKIHEVIELVESEEEDNTVVEVIQKGYYFKERVLKPAKVKVSQKIKPESSEEVTKDSENKETIN